MRHFALLLSCLLILSSLVRASEPPAEKTLAERLDLATHVIVGTAKSVHVVTSEKDKDGNIQVSEVKPEPKMLEGYRQSAEIEIEVNEVLYPKQWHHPKTIKMFFGGGWFEIQSIRDDLLGKQHIFVLSANQYGRLSTGEDLFTNSYGWNLFEPLESKPTIVDLLQKRVEREDKAAAPK